MPRLSFLPVARWALLRVLLDDQRLLHRRVDLGPVGPFEDLAGEAVVIRWIRGATDAVRSVASRTTCSAGLPVLSMMMSFGLT